MSRPQRLPVPAGAARDPKASEVLSVWLSGGEQQVALDPWVWGDPAAWGLLLVDLARHVANAHAQNPGAYAPAPAPSREEVLARIKQGFDAEWSHATDAPRGGLVDS